MKKVIILALATLILTSCGLRKDVEDIIENINEKVVLKTECNPNLSKMWNYRPNIFWEEEYPVDLTHIHLNEESSIPETLLEPIKIDLLIMLDDKLFELEQSLQEEPYKLIFLKNLKDRIIDELADHVTVEFSGNHSEGTFEVDASEPTKDLIASLLEIDELPTLITGSYKNNCSSLTIDLTTNTGVIESSFDEIILAN